VSAGTGSSGKTSTAARNAPCPPIEKGVEIDDLGARAEDDRGVLGDQRQLRAVEEPLVFARHAGEHEQEAAGFQRILSDTGTTPCVSR
jgi:hypothetical protein